MSANVTYRHGQFVWRELFTSDVEASVRFYTELYGWKTETMEMPDGQSYTMLKCGDVPVGGMMKAPMPGMPSCWISSVSVDDVAAAAERATAAGGKVLVPPMDAGGFGTYTSIQDPQGGVVSLWKSKDGDAPLGPDYRPGVGEFCWEQLNSSDLASSNAFYAAVLGWNQKLFMGSEDTKTWHAGEAPVASSMQAPPGVPTHWLTYVVVDTLAAAHGRVERGGGKVMMSRIDIPTVGAISVVQDNVGATIGLLEPPAA